MTIFKRLKPLLVLVILTTLVGCRLQVSAPIGGDVTWGDGEDDACLAGSICVIPINDADFNLTFTATAAVGYEFQGWEFRLRNETDPLTPIPVQCSNTDEDNNVCELSLLPFPLVAVDEILDSRSQGYLTPIYKILFTDTDGDGVFDADDSYPLISLGDLVDTDGDGIPDDCDAACVALGMAADDDDDGDGVFDADDFYPLISLGDLVDTDRDGIPDDCDAACQELGMAADDDDDGDDVPDGNDAFPKDASESQDTDEDGVGDNADLCEDTAEGATVDADGCVVAGPVDTDGDGDFDDDDFYPSISLGDLVDTDGDGIPDDCDAACRELGMAADDDDDGDDILDAVDAFPKNASESQDTDEDGVGDNADQCNGTLTGTAVDASGCTAVTVGESIPASVMADTVRFDKVIWVPADRAILAQPFTTIDSLTSYGNFIYHIVAGNSYNPPLNFWVSISPGGQAIAPTCYYSRGRDASTLVWSHFSTNRCVLEPNTSYYLNVQSDDPGPRSRIDRWIRVLRL